MLKMTRDIYGIRFGSDSILAAASRQKELYGIIFPEDPERAAREMGGFVLLGKQTPPANAPFTFFRNGITQIPEPGRAMVVVRVGERCEMDCGAEIMRFKRLIGDVPVVMLAQVFGNVRQSNPGTRAQNAESLRAHLQDSLGVKLSLIVDTAPQYVIPAPDSRYLYGQSRLFLDWADAGKSTVFRAAPQRTDVAGMVVINKQGRVVWESNFFNGQQDNKEFITKVIKKIASE